MTDDEIIDIGRSFPLLTHLLIEQNSKTTFICAVRACLAAQREDDARAIDTPPPKCRTCGHKWHYGPCVNLHPDKEPKS